MFDKRLWICLSSRVTDEPVSETSCWCCIAAIVTQRCEIMFGIGEPLTVSFERASKCVCVCMQGVQWSVCGQWEMAGVVYFWGRKMLKLAHVAGQCISPVVGQERGRIWSGAQRTRPQMPRTGHSGSNDRWKCIIGHFWKIRHNPAKEFWTISRRNTVAGVHICVIDL